MRLTGVPKGKVALQELEQLIPEGVLVTVPLPVPANESVSSWSASNEAVTDFEASIGTTHEPVPAHPPPLHPVKVDAGLGAAVSVTFVPRL